MHFNGRLYHSFEKLIIGAVVASAIFATNAFAAELYVDAKSKSGDGKRSSPFNTINAALSAAQAGDSIRVAAGTYPEKVVLTVDGIRLEGGYDSTFSGEADSRQHETIIDGQNKLRPCQIGDDTTAVKDFQLAGFTIRHGIADGVEGTEGKGGGIFIASDSSGQIVNCTITDNKATDDGGGIESNSNGALTIDRCLFSNNSAGDDGGAIRLQNSRTKATISNCVFVNNSGLDKYVVQAKGDVRILNCTFYNNLAEDRGIVASRAKTITTDAVVAITNCIFAGNTSKGRRPLLYTDDERAPIVCTNCLFFQNTAKGGLGTQVGSSGNLESDPMFVDASRGDLSLKNDSPAIDHGAPVVGIEKDCAGKPRVQGTGIDIGAFEFASERTVSKESR